MRNSIYRDGLKSEPILLSNIQAEPGRILLQPREHSLAHLCTLGVHRMSCWKWKETKQQPYSARLGHQLSCCLVSLNFLWDIQRSPRVKITHHPIWTEFQWGRKDFCANEALPSSSYEKLKLFLRIHHFGAQALLGESCLRRLGVSLQVFICPHTSP